MAKANKTAEAANNAVDTAVEEVKVSSFADVMEGKAQPTLKAIAEVLDVPQQRIYSVAKQPIAGQVFDPKVYNWNAISKFIEKRMGKADDKYKTFEEVYEAAMQRDVELGDADKRRGSRGGVKKDLIDLGDGKTMPQRRKEIKVGDVCYFKGSADSYKVTEVTSTHAVFQVNEGEERSVLSNWTFNQKVTDKPSVQVEPKTASENTADAE